MRKRLRQLVCCGLFWAVLLGAAGMSAPAEEASGRVVAIESYAERGWLGGSLTPEAAPDASFGAIGGIRLQASASFRTGWVDSQIGFTGLDGLGKSCDGLTFYIRMQEGTNLDYLQARVVSGDKTYDVFGASVEESGLQRITIDFYRAADEEGFSISQTAREGISGVILAFGSWSRDIRDCALDVSLSDLYAVRDANSDIPVLEAAGEDAAAGSADGADDDTDDEEGEPKAMPTAAQAGISAGILIVGAATAVLVYRVSRKKRAKQSGKAENRTESK